MLGLYNVYAPGLARHWATGPRSLVQKMTFQRQIGPRHTGATSSYAAPTSYAMYRR